MKKALILALLLLCIPCLASAATYYVSTSGNDANPGSESQPFRNISRCSFVAQAGDTCYVRQGTYDEQVTVRNSGSPGNFINFAGHPLDPKPVMRGFIISSKNYTRIIGFEITHNSASYNHGIQITGTSHNVEILNNYFHDHAGHSVRWYNHNCSYITVRGNEMYMAGCPAGVEGACIGNGWAVGFTGGHHLLIEYNHAHRVGDFMNVHAPYSIIRNNHLHDFRNYYWEDGSGDGLHCDMFQPTGSPLSNAKSQNQVYESNFMGDNIEPNSHILQMRATYEGHEDHHIIFRGNVGYNHGSYGMQSSAVDYVYYYSNTLYRMNQVSGWAAPVAGYSGEPRDTQTDGSTNNQNFNNIYADNGPNQGPPISIDSRCSTCSVTSSNNLCYLTRSHTSCASSSNPLFVDANSLDFHLQASSPAIGIGKAITTITSASGSGSSFNVADANFFIDGFGIAEGDLIRVGSSSPVRITSISGNRITVSRSISWSNGDGVYWRNQDTSPDIGAFEYNPDGYDYSLSIASPVDGSGVSGQVSITTQVANPDVIRYVIFYIDNIPASQDFDAPYTYTWDASGLPEGSLHAIEARAYPLYASAKLSAGQKINVAIGSGGLLEPVPGDLNGDGRVDVADLVIVVADFGKTNGFIDVDSDTNHDGIVDIADLVFVARRYTG